MVLIRDHTVTGQQWKKSNKIIQSFRKYIDMKIGVKKIPSLHIIISMLCQKFSSMARLNWRLSQFFMKLKQKLLISLVSHYSFCSYSQAFLNAGKASSTNFLQWSIFYKLIIRYQEGSGFKELLDNQCCFLLALIIINITYYINSIIH